MGNTIPISSTPRPSSSRATIYMEPRGLLGRLTIVGTEEEIDTIPSSLAGTVPEETYSSMIKSVSERLDAHRGGRVLLCVTLLQVLMLLPIIIGFFVTWLSARQFNFFRPITLLIMGSIETIIVVASSRLSLGEEQTLISDLLAILHPWKEEYGIAAKITKSRGKLTHHGVERGKDNRSSTFYCLVLEKIAPDAESTIRMSESDTDLESDVESNI